jgi:cyclopropane fatty-acyl-phospholipid synthase-like methyltransferase
MTDQNKPYSQACAENERPIRAVLGHYLSSVNALLEIGSGTGQHAVAFATAFPDLTWQASDLPENLRGIRLWIDEAGLPNLPPPLLLDVTGTWPHIRFDAVFSANTAHIMSDGQVRAMFGGISRVLTAGGLFLLYGPFNYGGCFTSNSNAAFHRWLKERDPASGIKEFEDLNELARCNDLQLLGDHAMPVNNRTLVWQRTPS